jgi:hypothetical protein
MTKAAANTGTDNTTKMAVNKMDQTNNGICPGFIPAARIPAIVTNRLILPKIELKPFKCKLNMAKSTEAPEC